jgi:hypothetical protein
MDAKLLIGWMTQKIDEIFFGYKGPMTKSVNRTIVSNG